jgi:hypothetical protein
VFQPIGQIFRTLDIDAHQSVVRTGPLARRTAASSSAKIALGRPLNLGAVFVDEKGAL